MIDDPSQDGEARRRDALARELHAVIRHGSAARRRAVIAFAEQLRGMIRDGDRRKPDAVERAIVILDELARAARITKRVWSDAIATSLASTRRDAPRGPR